MQRSIKEPIAEIFETCEIMSQAVNAHLSGDFAHADQFFRFSNSRAVWNWLYPAARRPDLNVKVRQPDGDTRTVPKEARDPDRNIAVAVRAAVLKRDGYRCRYCGIPVVDADIRKIARQLYPDAIPWLASDPVNEHAGFQCLWLQYDHVVPHSHGGRSTEENVVVCCALCNYGKDKYTLRQLDLIDPRLTPPVPSKWDGLERLRTALLPLSVVTIAPKSTEAGSVVGKDGIETILVGEVAIFLAGAWVSAGYLFTPPINGRERWFKLGAELSAEPVVRLGISGYRVVCAPEHLRRRGIDIIPLIDDIA